MFIYKLSCQFLLVCFLFANRFHKIDSNDLLSNTGLEDDLHFVFKWPGSLFNLEDDMRINYEILDIATANAEKYKCTLPALLSDEDEAKQELKESLQKDASSQIDTASLLKNIYDKKFCSYRIESYWIYELCHGQYIKQYHETKNAGKRVITEEYFLGNYHLEKQEPDYIKENDKLIPNIHWKTLEGQKVPTYGVRYTDGTPCDVMNNIPREITIFYACDENGNDNIATFEEVSSCVYEMLVVSKWICNNPAYKLAEKSKQTISCYSLESSPTKPRELVEIEAEQQSLREDENKIQMTDREGSTFIIHYKTIDETEEAVTSSEHLPEKTTPAPLEEKSTEKPSSQKHESNWHQEAEKSMITSFLTGAQCLNGGTGWWRYEICFGRHVTQYHEDENTKKRTNIVLGNWDNESHIEWMSKNPTRRPNPNKKDRSTISLYYSNGDRCEEANKPRFVEVKFKCLRSKENSHAVSLYLLEPMTCEYMLVVESAWLCNLVEKADDLTGLPTSIQLEDSEQQAKTP